LASIMVCQPDVLILDEPTSQLDPIAASDFFNTLRKINNELGTTIILCEHRLEEVLPLADRVLAMQDGKVLVCDSPKTAGKYLSQINSELFLAMPSPMRIAQAVGTQNELPVNVREGRKFLNDYVHDKHKEVSFYEHDNNTTCTNPTKYEDIISFKDVWFRYEKNGKDIVRDLSISIKKGTIHAVVGANGAGKTTLIKLISRQVAAYRGKILINNVNLKNVSDKELFHNNLAVLPQNPTVLFSCKTARLDLLDMLSDTNFTLEQKEEKVRKTASQVGLEPVLERHPFDLSGGEQQRLGLAKILLCEPKIILLDEPSKGLDQCFKEEFAQILYSLQERGITIVIVSHDIEFLAKHSDFCSMFFNGSITTTQKSKVFFAKNSFYTTAANRIARKVFPNAVTDEEVIFECKSLLTKENS
ncbi:MAG: ATP-binding cassette domain-containing protein, partial [Oscillospiraceae bacterium]